MEEEEEDMKEQEGEREREILGMETKQNHMDEEKRKKGIVKKELIAT